MAAKHIYTTDYQIGIGAMTGTSLDGLDLALCEFRQNGYIILDFQCIKLPEKLRQSLTKAYTENSRVYFEIEQEYSQFIGDAILEFHRATKEVAEFVGIHGQTIFHDPDRKLSVQMINGGQVAAISGLTTVCDFRRTDIAYGGQGAPLVPIGDRDLFSGYQACLNLGGFANLSSQVNGTRVAFDICPVNLVLNQLAKNEGEEYDDGGRMASSAKQDVNLLSKLNALRFYHSKPPKSLGREWVERQIFPLLSAVENRVALRTYTDHAAEQIARNLPQNGKILVTGGGTYNRFLISQIKKEQPKASLIIPDQNLIEGKEAMIFAYLAKMRLAGRVNVLSSATGASKDSSSGAIYLP